MTTTFTGALTQVLGVTCLVFAGYLLLLTTLGAAARLGRARRAVRLLDRFTAGPLRKLLDRLFGVGLSLAAMSTPMAAPPAPTPVLSAEQTQVSTAKPSNASADTCELIAPVLSAQADSSPSTVNAVPLLVRLPPLHSESLPMAQLSRTRTASSTWTVKPGDHLWSIAEQVLTANSKPTNNSEIRRYWRELIAANRANLRDPSNADLIVPGELLVLPPT